MTVDTTAPATTRRATRSRANRFDWTGGVVSDALLSIAVALWVLAVSGVRIEAMGDLGLLSVLPVTFFVGLALVIVSATLLLAAPEPSEKRLFLHVVALVVMLYGTAPLVYAEPRYSWLYKHLGVVEFIGTQHHLERHIDIFHNWPGFFAAAAVLDRLAGVSNPIVVAAWAQLFFNLLNVLVLSFATRALGLTWRERWVALLIFSGANWIAQDYYSPQAAGFVLGLGIFAITLNSCRGGRPPRWLDALSERIHTLVRASAPHPAKAVRRLRQSTPWASIAAILLAQGALVVMHELSPYVVALELGLLTLLGQIRPRWLAATLLALPLAYLIPRFRYVNQTYGLLDSVGSFFSNARPPSALGLQLAHDQQLVANVSRALSILVWFLAIVGAWRRLREGRPVLVLAVLAFSPFLLLFLQNYGGEVLLRVELFSLPWSACLAASAVRPWRTGERAHGRLLCGASLALVVALFLPAYFGNDKINQMSSSAVRASRYLYSHGKSGPVVYLDKNFPISNGARYNLFFPIVYLVDESSRLPVTLRTADVASITSIAQEVSTKARRAYLVLSPGMLEYARAYGLTKSSSLRPLERGLDRSPDWRVFYRDGETTIYQLE